MKPGVEKKERARIAQLNGLAHIGVDLLQTLGLLDSDSLGREAYAGKMTE